MGIVYATQTLHITKGPHAGTPICAGDSYDSDDPIVRAFPSVFVSDDPRPARSTRTTTGYVEDATARPGEKRNVRRG